MQKVAIKQSVVFWMVNPILLIAVNHNMSVSGLGNLLWTYFMHKTGGRLDYVS
jgi:hypothetical protein